MTHLYSAHAGASGAMIAFGATWVVSHAALAWPNRKQRAERAARRLTWADEQR